jgi:hypothetical protein
LDRKKQERSSAFIYRNDGIPSSDGKDVGAGDGLLADGLDLRLDVVDDAEAPQGPRVRECVLLAGEGGRVRQQHGTVASLNITYVRTR